MLLTSKCLRRHKVVGLSHPGAIRSNNEDVINWWYEPQQGLTFALVADGMGGHEGGAEASLLASERIRKRTNSLTHDFSGDMERLKVLMISALEDANVELLKAQEANENMSKMGTTIVFVAVFNHQLVVLHVGDSRCYLLGREKRYFDQLTRDDSVVQAMLDEGLITEKDASTVPYRNRLTNALGMKAALEYSVSVRKIDLEDVVLLCTDGFYQAVDLSHVSDFVQSNGCTQAAAQSLLEISLNNNTNDNTSLVLIASEADASEV